MCYSLVNYKLETSQKKAVVALPISSQTHITERGKWQGKKRDIDNLTHFLRRVPFLNPLKTSESL